MNLGYIQIAHLLLRDGSLPTDQIRLFRIKECDLDLLSARAPVLVPLVRVAKPSRDR